MSINLPSSLQHFQSWLLVWGVMTFLLFSQTAHAHSYSFSFYSAELIVECEQTDWAQKEPLTYSNTTLQSHFRYLENSFPDQLLEQLLKHKAELALNDWLYYEMILEALRAIHPSGSKNQITLLAWYLLVSSDYDTRITYLQSQLYLYAYSNESIFETPMIVDKGRHFINLTHIHNRQPDSGQRLNMFAPSVSNLDKSFSFDLSDLPQLPIKKLSRKFAFKSGEQSYAFEVDIDQTIYQLLNHYPIFEEIKYMEIPFSETVRSSLIPQMEKILTGKAQLEQLQILVAFTRSAFKYKEDKEHFGYSRPMIPEEVLHYPYSDCEDRSALFYRLVKNILDLPMIVIGYENHLTVAVATTEPIGQAISFEGKDYYICDPTGPSNSNDVGAPPEEYRGQRFEILTLKNAP